MERIFINRVLNECTIDSEKNLALFTKYQGRLINTLMLKLKVSNRTAQQMIEFVLGADALQKELEAFAESRGLCVCPKCNGAQKLAEYYYRFDGGTCYKCSGQGFVKK